MQGSWIPMVDANNAMVERNFKLVLLSVVLKLYLNIGAWPQYQLVDTKDAMRDRSVQSLTVFSFVSPLNIDAGQLDSYGGCQQCDGRKNFKLVLLSVVLKLYLNIGAWPQYQLVDTKDAMRAMRDRSVQSLTVFSL
ncbi:hypothetical protein CDAR_541101 [Caerostris darwini]|uniref:Uncharacterized protein n=1 Tax=Caerostris darwini TaxID=1538125 RepID=A0AAV4VQV7_9ARAC|nr:hypothetical protein CDAR_541101 [Caerostris darwini]